MADSSDTYGTDWDPDMYDPGVMDEWGSEFGSALSGAGTGAATGAAIGSMVPVVGTAVGAAMGAGVGAIGGWLAGRDNEQQQAMAKQKYIQDTMLTEAMLYASGEKQSAAVKMATTRFANMQQSLRASVFSNPNLTEEQKWMQFNKLKSDLQAKSHQAVGQLQLQSQESAKAQIASINNMQFAQAVQEKQAQQAREDKFLNTMLNVAQTSLTLAAKQGMFDKEEVPKTAAPSAGISSPSVGSTSSAATQSPAAGQDMTLVPDNFELGGNINRPGQGQGALSPGSLNVQGVLPSWAQQEDNVLRHYNDFDYSTERSRSVRENLQRSQPGILGVNLFGGTEGD